MRPTWLIEAGVYGDEAVPLLDEIHRQGMVGEWSKAPWGENLRMLLRAARELSKELEHYEIICPLHLAASTFSDLPGGVYTLIWVSTIPGELHTGTLVMVTWPFVKVVIGSSFRAG